VKSLSYSSGTMEAWVNIPSLSASSNTDIYLYYGYASSSDQQNAMATWNSDYKGVWHLKENGAPYSDSTSNGNNSDAGI